MMLFGFKIHPSIPEYKVSVQCVQSQCAMQTHTNARAWAGRVFDRPYCA